jgi:hypothetical protein
VKRLSPFADHKLHQVWHRVWHDTDSTRFLTDTHALLLPNELSD